MHNSAMQKQAFRAAWDRRPKAHGHRYRRLLRRHRDCQQQNQYDVALLRMISRALFWAKLSTESVTARNR